MKEKEMIRSKKQIVIFPIIISLIGAVMVMCVLFDGGLEALADYMFYGGAIERLLSYGGILLTIVGLLLFFQLKDGEIVVTDKRVYGKSAFGKRVDLPVDSISAVGIFDLFNSLIVSTSSGAIKFYSIGNRSDIHKAINNLIINRQENQRTVQVQTIKDEIPQSNADELKKYKDLLDSGIITQEEFEAKKRQLLGL